MSPLKVAVIGIGSIARRAHLPGYLHAGAKITALCSPHAPDLEEVAAQYNAGTWRDWRAMLREGDFDAVSICTPPVLHAEMSVACSQRGLHVLVEKPMAITLEECDRMIAAARQAGKILMVFHNERCSPHHRHAREILASGVLGEPYLAHAVIGHGGPEVWSPSSAWFFQPHQAGRGVLADLAYHKIDLLRWLLGQEISEVCALASTFEKDTPLEDTASILLHFAGGTLGSVQASWVLRPEWENTVAVHCRRGRLTVPTGQKTPLRVERLGPDGERIETTHTCSTEDETGWQEAVARFVHAASNGLPSPIPGEDGRATLAAVLAAFDSSQSRKFIRL